MKISTSILLLLFIFSTSCKKNYIPKNTINGTWKSIGSGWILDIQDSTNYHFYDITAISCLPNQSGAFQEIEASLNLKNDTLSYLRGVISYQFVRIQSLPETCIFPLQEEQIKDPIFNFNVFANTVKEHYAFMELNNIQWSKIYKQQLKKLKATPTPTNLYLTIEETLEQLKDNHAFLEADEQLYASLESLQQEEEETLEQEPLPEYGDFQIAEMVSKHHLQEDLTEDSWLIKWGKLTEDVSYIQIKAMWLYADLNIPEFLIDSLGYVNAYVETFHQMDEGKYIKKEVEGVRKIMDKVMQDLGNSTSIVIDVRFNGGGQDAVSFEILSRFIKGKQQIATQKLWYANQFSPTQALYIQGVENAFTKPVFVLTSPQTGSAAEAFSIATMSIDHIKRIGAPTSGALSTALEKTLPNGWVFSISNEIYMDNQGNKYENIGIPVDLALAYAKDRQTFFRNIADNLEKDKLEIFEAVKKLNQ